MSSSLAYTRSGSGAPLVLLHGIGLNRRSWNPVVPALAQHFDVIAVDMPGFGDSAQATPGQADPRALAEAVAGLLAELGVTIPHLAGNSLGGWVALELAAIRPVASVTLLDPAGLWKQGAPLYCRVSLRASRWLARHAGRPLSRLVRYRLGRVLVLGQTHGRPTRLTPGYAQETIASMGTCERVGIKQHQVSNLPRLNGAQRFVQAKKLCGIESGCSQAFGRSQSADDHQRQFFMQAETRKAEWIAGVRSRQKWHACALHRTHNLNLFPENLFGVIVVISISDALAPALTYRARYILEPRVIPEALIAEVGVAAQNRQRRRLPGLVLQEACE